MKVAAVIKVYRGCLESIQIFSEPDKACKRYAEILKEYNLSEENIAESDYDITLETELLVY